MPNITINREYLLKLIGKKIEEKNLEEIIYKLGFEVERSDLNELTVEITSNRPDLFSAVGLARAIRNFQHINKTFNYSLHKKNLSSALTISVDKTAEKSGLFISGFVIKNILLTDVSLADIFNFSEKLSDTLGRMRKKMSIGIHNLDVIDKDIVFILSEDEKFIPLRDNSQRLYSDVVDNTEKGKLYRTALPKSGLYPILKDSKGTLALVPIINSERTKVTPSTKNLFIEVTGTSSDLVEKITNILATTFIDIGGDIFGIDVKYTKKTKRYPDFDTNNILIPLLQIELELGIEIGFNNIISLANKAGYEAALLGKKIRFKVPSYRADIINEQDIIEDICIAYGYDYISPIPVPSILPGALSKNHELFEGLSYAMVGAGFTESMSTYLTNEQRNFLMMNLDIPQKTDFIKLKDAKSSNLSIARTWLIPSILNVISISKHDKMPQKVFELDMVFKIYDNKPIESYHLAGICTNSVSNFNDIKSIVESILSVSGFSFSIKETSHKSFIDGRCAAIIIDGIELGIMGELHPIVLSNFGIEEPSIGFEIELL